MNWLFPFFVFPVLIPTAYVYSKSIAACIDWLLEFVGFTTTSVVTSSNLTSLLEVAIGVNLALSILTSFSQFIGKVFAKTVNDLDPDQNPTFLEAMVEAAARNGQELGAPLSVPPLQSKYIQDVKQQIANFNDDTTQSERAMKLLGILTALCGFVLLVGVAKNSNVLLPISIFWILVLGLVLPVVSHILFLGYQYGIYLFNVKALKKNGNSGVYQAYIKDVHKIYKEKKRLTKGIKVPLQ